MTQKTSQPEYLSQKAMAGNYRLAYVLAQLEQTPGARKAYEAARLWQTEAAQKRSQGTSTPERSQRNYVTAWVLFVSNYEPAEVARECFQSTVKTLGGIEGCRGDARDEFELFLALYHRGRLCAFLKDPV